MYTRTIKSKACGSTRRLGVLVSGLTDLTFISNRWRGGEKKQERREKGKAQHSMSNRWWASHLPQKARNCVCLANRFWQLLRGSSSQRHIIAADGVPASAGEDGWGMWRFLGGTQRGAWSEKVPCGREGALMVDKSEVTRVTLHTVVYLCMKQRFANIFSLKVMERKDAHTVFVFSVIKCKGITFTSLLFLCVM